MNVNLITEEIACLLYLCGHGGEQSVVGVVGFASVDDDGFDVGMRALHSRGLAVWVEEGVKLAAEAETAAGALAAPVHLGYCVVADENTESAATLCTRGESTVLVQPRAVGVFELTVADQPAPETILEIGRSAVVAAGSARAMVRFQGVGNPPIDIVFDPDAIGVVRQGAIESRDERAVLDELRGYLAAVAESTEDAAAEQLAT